MVTDQIDATAAIILDGSHAWGADSLGELCPRMLLPVANMPLLGHLFRWLVEAGVSRTVMCADGVDDAMRHYLRDGAGDMDVTYHVDQSPRGAAGCCGDAASLVSANNYVLIDGALLPGVDILALLAEHTHQDAALTVAVNPGVGLGTGFAETGGPTGIYVIAARAFEHVPETGYYDIKEMLIPRLREAGETVVAHQSHRPTPRITGFDSYLAMQAWALQTPAPRAEGATTYAARGSAIVHETAQVAGSAQFLGPAVVGPGAHIGEDAIVVGPSVVGPRCVVGSQSVVGRSVLWAGASVGTHAAIDQCLVTRDSHVAPEALRHGEICDGGVSA